MFSPITSVLMRVAVILTVGVFCVQAADPTITPWSRGKDGAFSLTFDDQSSGQFSIAVPLMNQHGIRGTIFVFWVDDLVRSAAANGHEIGSHTATHSADGSQAKIEADLEAHRRYIDSLVPGYHCATIAWPGGGAGATQFAAAKKVFIAGRNLGSNVEAVPVKPEPINIFGLPTWLGTLSSYPGGMSHFISRAVDTTLQEKGWMSFTYHNVNADGTDDEADATQATLGMELDTLKAHESRLWIAPYGEVARYVWERKYARITQISATQTQVTYRLTHALDSVFAASNFSVDSIFVLPLTLTMALPSGWTNATVTQDGMAVWSQMSTVGAVKTLLFEAVPKKGDIVISSSAATVAQNHPTRPGVSQGQSVVRLVDIRGRMVGTGRRAGLIIASGTHGQAARMNANVGVGR